jgi:hypothetical protein
MKNIQRLLTGLATVGLISTNSFNGLPAQANYNEKQKISQTSREPTFKEDLHRYGNKAKKSWK